MTGEFDRMAAVRRAARERQAERFVNAERQKLREEIARDLLLKLVESTPGALKYDTKFQVAKALEYTDELLAQLDKGEAPCDKTK